MFDADTMGTTMAGLGGGSAVVMFAFWAIRKTWRGFSSELVNTKEDRSNEALISHFSRELERLEAIIDRQSVRLDKQADTIAVLNTHYLAVRGLLLDSRDALRSLNHDNSHPSITALCARIDQLIESTEH